jgi:hypothetical protein
VFAGVVRPVEQDEGGVVLESSALVREHGGGEPAQGFWAGEVGASGEVD